MLEAGEGVIRRISTEINQAQQDLNTIRTKLDSELMPMQQGFKGGAGTAFQDLMQQWQVKQGQINGALSDFENALIGADKVNEEQDSTSSSSFSNLTSKMGGGPA